jgi:hypothetical protein
LLSSQGIYINLVINRPRVSRFRQKKIKKKKRVGERAMKRRLQPKTSRKHDKIRDKGRE